MVSVNELIGQLLLQHNCVVIPGFGGFVASQTSSVIDFNHGTMSPPKKSLLFNKQLINNDGLLISELSISNRLSFEKAQEEVQQTVSNWNSTLRSGAQIELPTVGRLFFDAENNICFEQDRFFNLLLQSYGLSKIHFVAEEDVKIVEKIVERETVVVQEKEEDLNSIEPVVAAEVKVIQLPTTKPKVWKYIAAACILPIAFYSVWIPVKTDVLESGILSIKDFNPFYSKGEAVYKAQQYELKNLPVAERSLSEEIANISSDVAVYSYRFDQDTYVAVRVKEGENAPVSVPEELVETSATPIKTENTSTIKGQFSYIVGCFSNKVNASKLVKKLQAEGLNAFIAGNASGLTRVSAGTANSQQEIQSIASKAQALGFTGWILKN